MSNMKFFFLCAVICGAHGNVQFCMLFASLWLLEVYAFLEANK
jgi:hypothetical protein